MLYNSTSIYNATKTYNDGANGVDPGLQLNLNRVIGITNPTNFLDAQGAANVWAGTEGLSLIGALNVKAGTSGMELNSVCDTLASTNFLDADGASQSFA